VNSKQNKTNNPYAIFDTPTGMTNDAMSGWRTQAKAMNDMYKHNATDESGDILGFGNSDTFKGWSVDKQNQYYTDLANYNALANTIAGYDADYLREAEEAKRAEEYANNRRSLIEKYMPETLAAMGYANTGLAGDALLKMNNAYDNYIIEAQDKAARNQNDLMSTYREKAMEIESGINAEKQEVLKAQQDLYNDYLTKIYKGEGLDTAGVETAVKLGALTEEQKQQLYDKAGGWSGDGLTKVGDIPLAQSTADKTVAPIYTSDTGATARSKFVGSVSTAGKNRQDAFVQDVLNASSTWGEEMNGTLVDFNYGWSTSKNDEGATTVYVFYWNPSTKKGEWRLTTLDRWEARDNYGDKFYVGERKGKVTHAMPGNDFYNSKMWKDYEKSKNK
jgi:hypothetical protein